MLNETYRLTQTLKAMGVNLSELHPTISDEKNPQKYLVVTINGKDFSIEQAGEERKMWSYAKSNFLLFPRGKIRNPLIQMASEDFPEQGTELCEYLLSVAQSAPLTKDEDILKKFWKFWQENSAQIYDNFLEFLRPGEPLEVFLKERKSLGEYTKKKAQTVLRQFVIRLAEASREGRVSPKTVRKLFVKGKTEDNTDFDFYLEGTPSLFPDSVKIRFSDLLYETSRAETSAEGTCSLSGERVELVNKTFPKPKLPILEGTILMSMFSDNKCHQRYGRTSIQICPVGQKLAEEMANALMKICATDREGRTWQGIAQEKKGKPDLLLIYSDENPRFNSPLAKTIAGSEDWEDETMTDGIASFADAAKTVCDALRTEVPDCKNPHLRCFILRRIDKGRVQVLDSSEFTIEELFTAAEQWKSGAENTPPLELYYPAKKGVPPTPHSVQAPHLTRVMEIFKNQWDSSATRKNDVHGIPFMEVLRLFLNRNDTTFSPSELLSKLLRRTEHVLRCVGENFHGNTSANSTIEMKRLALNTVAFIGILLDKMNIHKEDYMNELTFQLGRLLSLVDSLHLQYCKHVRSEDVPPKLIGNSFIPIVCDHPAAGLGQLLDRLTVYQAWANKFLNDKKSQEKTSAKDLGLVGWCSRELRETAAKITAAGLSNKRLNDVEKAQLLLGYLAPFEKKASDEQSLQLS